MAATQPRPARDVSRDTPTQHRSRHAKRDTSSRLVRHRSLRIRSVRHRWRTGCRRPPPPARTHARRESCGCSRQCAPTVCTWWVRMCVVACVTWPVLRANSASPAPSSATEATTFGRSRSRTWLLGSMTAYTDHTQQHRVHRSSRPAARPRPDMTPPRYSVVRTHTTRA
jgi:hypothetical protein